MNWGKGIVVVFVIFFSGLAFMVYKSMTKDVDLVAQNYYEKEIKYQDQINKIKNTSRLEEKVKFENTGSSLIVTFPQKTGLNGEISFYRPSDAKLDFRLSVDPDKDYKQVIDTRILLRGLWRVQISWNAGGENYYNEEKIMLQ